MTTITAFTDLDDYFFNAFDDVEVNSVSRSQVVVTEVNTGFVTTFTGSNLSDPTVDPVSGTITSFTTTQNGQTLVSFTGLSVSGQDFVDAIGAALGEEDDGPLTDIFNDNGPLTIDASGSDVGVFFDLFDLTVPITLTGSDFRDELGGGLRNDTIIPGDTDDGEVIIGSGGSDRIDFSQHPDDQWATLYYGDLSLVGNGESFITVTVDGNANTATIVKDGIGTDTIIDVRKVLQADGLTLEGTRFDDTFTVDGGDDSWMQIFGDEGDDTFNITLSDTVRLTYSFFSFGGINANLAAGTIQDGFGSTDTVTIQGGDGRLEIEATDLNDTITGSGRDERFILRAGNDQLDAGDGYDTLRYDRSDVGAINANLETGIVTGLWDGVFFNHTVSNVEEIRGSREDDDFMQGSSRDERFEGRGGDDTIIGGGGDDEIRGDDGNDSLVGGDGEEDISGGEGNDTIISGDGPGDARGEEGNDLIDLSGMTYGWGGGTRPGLGQDTVIGSEALWTGPEEEGHDIRYNELPDVGGLTITVGNLGIGTAVSGDGRVNDTFSYFHYFEGTGGDDSFTSTDTEGRFQGWVGHAGNDTITGGDGDPNGFDFDQINYWDEFRDHEEGSTAQGVTVNFLTGQATDTYGDTDTFSGLESVRGTPLADIFIANDDWNSFRGFDGNDSVTGNADGYTRMNYSSEHDRGGSTGITADLEAGTIVDTFGDTDTVSDLSEVRGSQFNDMIMGTFGEERLRGEDGDDILFGDGFDVSAYGEISAQVFRLYLATLGREADVLGHEGWVKYLAGGSGTYNDVIAGFTQSAEFQDTYGTLSSADFVTLLYQNVLGRTPAPAELQSWLDFIADGLTEAQVVTGFAESAEFQLGTAVTSAAYTEARAAQSWSDDVYRLYLATLDREADAAGLQGWAEALAGGFDFKQTVAGFTNSTEFQTTYGTLTDTQFVELLYQNVLDRAPASAEVQAWLDFIGGGGTREDVVIGFSQSDEFRDATAADVTAWMRNQDTHDRLQGDGGTNQLSGGLFSDVFSFNADTSTTTTITDLEAWDYLDLFGFGYGSADDALARMTDVGGDVVFADQGVTITIEDFAKADITDEMIWI